MTTATPDTTVSAPDAARAALERLAHQRRRLDAANNTLTPLRLDLETQIDALEAAFEAENKALLDEVAAAQDAVTQAENDARTMMLLAYAETGQKRLDNAPGAQVKEFTVVQFDPAEGFDYALKYNLSILRLDRKSYERALKEWSAEDGTPTMPGEVKTEPRVYIDGNLDAHYPPAPEPEQEPTSE